MPPELQYLTIWEKFGLPGLVIAALIFVIYALYRYVIQPMMSLHRDERKEWLDTCKIVFDRHDQRQIETNECIRELTASQQTMAATLAAINERSRRYDDTPKDSELETPEPSARYPPQRRAVAR